MPNISDFKNSQKPKTARVIPQDAEESVSEGVAEEIAPAGKRRPGRGGETKSKIKIVEVEAMASSDENDKKDSTGAHGSADKIELNFPGSEILRANFPKSFKTAEAVVTDWVHDGKFEEIPAVTNPLAKAAVQQGLIKAKNLEKKVMASPVTEKVTMQAFNYAMKASAFVKEIREKVQKK